MHCTTNMKFLLDLVSCYHGGKYVAAPPTPPQMEASGIKRCKPGKLARRSLVAAAPWRPSLCTISEDYVIIKVEQPEGSAKPNSKLKGDVRSKANFLYSGYQAPYETSLPTFSAVGFLF